MKYLIEFGRIDELKKSFTYIDRTSSLYSEKGDPKLSRFSEYSTVNTQGWELMGMKEVDDDGYESNGRYIQMKNFKYDNNLSDRDEDILKKVISVSLSEIANRSWIDGFKFGENKAYATILLGKIGFVFGNKHYVPVLRYPSGKEGTTFWLSAEFDKGEQWAKTVIVTKADISDNEIEHNGINLLQSTYRKLWEEENKRRKEQERPLLPESSIKKVNNMAYIKSLDIVRNTGEKQYFVVYVQGSKYNPIDFARRACGVNIELKLPRYVALDDADKMKRAYNKQNVWYYPIFKDKKGESLEDSKKRRELAERGAIFYYKDKNSNKWLPAIFVRVKKTKGNVDYKEIEIRTPKGGIQVLEVRSGDKLKIPKIDKKNTEKIEYFEVEVAKIDPKDNKKLQLRDVN